jgi:hypothetical protein
MTPHLDSARPASTERQIELLEQALRQTRWNLTLIVLLLLAYAAAVAGAIYFVRHGVKKKEDELLGAVRERLVQDMGPITKEAGDLAASVTPPVAEAFTDQLKKDLPVLTRTVEQEGKDVADHLETSLRKDLEARYRVERPKYRAILKQEFTEIKDEADIDRLMDQFDAAFQKLIRRYHLKEYRNRVDRTAELWKKIPPAPSPQAGAKSLADQLGDDLSQWLQMKMVEGGIQPAGKEQGK